MEFCRDTPLYLSLKLDGMLEPEEARALEEHLACCPRCRALERELSAIHTALPELEEYKALEGFARSVMERVADLEEKPKVVPLFRRPQVRALMGLAACAVLCVGLYRGGLFQRDAVGLSTVASDGAVYQDSETSAAGAKQADEPALADAETQPTNDLPEGEKIELEPGTREAPGTDGAESGDQDAVPPDTAPADAAQEEPGIQPSQFGVTAQAPEGLFVAGQQVAAVLTVDRLPQGWEDVLGQTPEWLTDEAGRACCIITATQLQQLGTLAQQEGTVTAALEGRTEGEQPCALVVLEGVQ